MSQVQLAKRVGVATGTVAGWELGDHGIRKGKLKRVAKVLKLSVEELLS